MCSQQDDDEWDEQPDDDDESINHEFHEAFEDDEGDDYDPWFDQTYDEFQQ
jgi:hypothetical protein